MKLFRLASVFSIAILLVPCPSWADNSSRDGSDVKTYWQGSQLNNQSRLGQPFEGFEVQGEKHSLEKRTADEYLSKIRQESAQASKASGKENILNFQTPGFERALSISYAADRTQILTLRLHLLFDQNAVGLRTGSFEILDRVAQILNQAPARPVHLVMEDELDDAPTARTTDAERTRFVTAYLAFAKERPAGQETLYYTAD